MERIMEGTGGGGDGGGLGESVEIEDGEIVEEPHKGVYGRRTIARTDTNDADEEEHEHISSLDVEFLKRVLLGKDISPPKNRRTLSCEQSGSSHLWGGSPSRCVRPRKRTSAPQFGRTNTIKNAVVLRSRRSWPVAPPRIRRYSMCTFFSLK